MTSDEMIIVALGNMDGDDKYRHLIEDLTELLGGKYADTELDAYWMQSGTRIRYAGGTQMREILAQALRRAQQIVKTGYVPQLDRNLS
jgi:hypothetical protein